MKALLAKLDVEGFVLDIDGSVPARCRRSRAPRCSASTTTRSNWRCRARWTSTACSPRSNDAGIRVRSMRTKANRLEELFVRLTSKDTK